MCLIIFSPNIRRSKIRRAVLQRGFNKNDDGAGFAYVENDKVRLSKAYFDFDEFFLEYQRVRSRIHTGPLLIHFRWATCGSNNFTNTQPLTIYRNKLVMAHNGVFPGLSGAKGNISDSVVLTRLIRKLRWAFPFTGARPDMLKGLCDNYSKLVFIDNKGRYTIINEQLGSWREGSWYSDKAECYKPPFSDFPKFSSHDRDESKAKKPTCPYPSRSPGRKMTAEEQADYEQWMKYLHESEREDGPEDDDPDTLEEREWIARYVGSGISDKKQRVPHSDWVHGEGYDDDFRL